MLRAIALAGIIALVARAQPGQARLVAYVAGDNVEALDIATNTEIANIPLSSTARCQRLAVSPDGAFVYVTGLKDEGLGLLGDTVYVISTATNAVVETIYVGRWAGTTGVVAAPDGRTVYVANSASNTISAIDLIDHAAYTSEAGQQPSALAFSAHGERLYAPNNDPSGGTVTVIDTAARAIAATIGVQYGPFGIALTPGGAFAYVTNRCGTDPNCTSVPGSVSVIDTATNLVTATIPVGLTPMGVAAQPNGHTVYVADASASDLSVSLSVIDTQTNAVTTNIALSPIGLPRDVAFTPDGTRAYVVSFGFSAWIIDTATNTVITTIPLDVPNICGIAMAEVPDIAPTPRPTETATPTAEPHPTPSPRPCSTQRARAARSTDTAQFREFEVPYVPGGITAGPDGNIWFTEYFGMRIDRLTLDGAVTAFPIPESASVAEGISTGITVGPEGNLWFTIGNAIGRMTLEGTFTVFPLPSGSSSPTGITLGPDGNLWFTESNIGQVGRITPQGKITEFPSTLATQPMAIVSGPDGNLWFTEAELPISSGQTAG